MSPRLVVAALLLVARAAAAEPAPCELSSKDAQEVRAVIETYRTSWLRGDAKGVLATFTPDAVLLPANGAAPIAGTAAITAYWWPAGAPPTTITKLDITVDRVEGDCRIAHAYGHDDVEWTSVDKGVTKTHGHPGTYLNVFQKMPDGSWRIARHMWDDGPSR